MLATIPSTPFVPPQTLTLPTIGAQPPAQPPGALRRAVEWIDEYSRPRPATAGDFAQHDYGQALIHAVEAGFAFMSLRGVAIAAAAGITSTFVVRHTHSRAAGLVAGAITGGLAAAGVAAATGSSPLALAVGGTLLGALQCLRGDRESNVRDASGGATMLTGLFLPGTTKIAGALGAGIGASCKSTAQKAVVGAAVAGAIGAALGASGLAPGGPLFAGAISAAGGLIGPFWGPRFSQTFRNLANDAGTALGGVAKRHDIGVSETTANCLGAFPAQFAKEGIRSFINSDFNPGAIVVSGLLESVELIHIFRNQKQPTQPTPTPPTPTQPPASQPPH